jgi:hypothetical protein
MSTEVRREDFSEWDWDVIADAGSTVMGLIQDLAFHNCNPGDGWAPFAQYPDTPALIAEVRGHIERLEEAVKKAKAGIASVERPDVSADTTPGGDLSAALPPIVLDALTHALEVTGVAWSPHAERQAIAGVMADYLLSSLRGQGVQIVASEHSRG